VVAGLGLLIALFLLPYLVSSVFSIVTTVLQTTTASTWLWGDWLNSFIGQDHPAYMFLAEGPICCSGIITLVLVVLGAVVMASGLGNDEDEYYDDYDEDFYEEWEG
jgi:hypothetical protein